ncbi:hypothetical protein L3Y34_011270 [Caenorhabditis briggsae]|uniref:DUF38 domain-containing protein n=1 Tax=Caenorhabditis briggsae TaxID=6238 RepID=A0AAE8ZQZ1_CAEBR|nr:hypothetical protein L3Y34_011270 [Caenorhabditis briggsae]
MQNAVEDVVHRRNGILLYFQLQHDVLRTVTDLKNVFPDVTFSEVDAWFTRFRSGNNDIVTPVVFNEGAPGMANIPVHLKRKITENVGYTEQKALLTVNSTFREILKADRRIFKEIAVRHGMNGISLLFRVETVGVKESKFFKKSEGSEIHNGNIVTVSTHPYYVEAWNQLAKVLSKDFIKVNEWVIDVEKEQQDRELFLLEMKKCLASLKNKIHVEVLEASLKTNEDVVAVLEAIKVGSIRKSTLNTDEKDGPLRLNDSLQLSPHLSSMKEAKWSRVILDIPLSYMTHLARFAAEIYNLDLEDLMEYKNKIIAAPNFKYGTLYGTYLREDVLTALQPFQQENNIDETVGSWPHASLADHKIIFKLERSILMPVILDPTSQNYKRTAIHCFFKAGIEASDVVKKLDETFPATTAQEVTSWFNRFKEGNLEIGEQISINASGIIIDSSIVLKREIHDSGVADDQPPARVNPADVKREVEEDGTRPNNQQLVFRSNPMQQTKGGFQLNQSPPIVQRPQDQAPMIPMHRFPFPIPMFTNGWQRPMMPPFLPMDVGSLHQQGHFHIDGGSAWNWPPSRVHVMGEMQLPVPRNTPPIAKLPVERSIEGNVRNSLSVSIRLDVDCVTLQLKRPDDSQTTMDFTKRTGNRCEIDITGTPTNIVRNWYIAEALREFKKILRFHGMRFTSLAITSAEDERDRVAFMEIIGKTFQKLTEKLYVYELEIGVNKKSEMFPILEKVHVGPLKRFSLSGRSDINERIYLEDTPSLALHLPHLRFLHWPNLENDIPLQYFTDLISYQGHQRTISRAQVALYKNKICQSEQFVESIIYGNISEDLVATLKPFDQPEPYDTSIGSWVTTDRHTIRIYFKFDPNALQFQKSTFKIR